MDILAQLERRLESATPGRRVVLFMSMVRTALAAYHAGAMQPLEVRDRLLVAGAYAHDLCPAHGALAPGADLTGLVLDLVGSLREGSPHPPDPEVAMADLEQLVRHFDEVGPLPQRGRPGGS